MERKIVGVTGVIGSGKDSFSKPFIDAGFVKISFADTLKDTVSAISCGICNKEALLDLDYSEDSSAETDSNFVMTGEGKLVEVQGTAEGAPFSTEELLQLLDLAKKGCNEVRALQTAVLGYKGK